MGAIMVPPSRGTARTQGSRQPEVADQGASMSAVSYPGMCPAPIPRPRLAYRDQARSAPLAGRMRGRRDWPCLP